MTYFTYILDVGYGNKRRWYVEEFAAGNPLHKIHVTFKLVFKTREACEMAIVKKMKKEGGELLHEVPRMGRVSGFKQEKGKRGRRYYSSPSREIWT